MQTRGFLLDSGQRQTACASLSLSHLQPHLLPAVLRLHLLPETSRIAGARRRRPGRRKRTPPDRKDPGLRSFHRDAPGGADRASRLAAPGPGAAAPRGSRGAGQSRPLRDLRLLARRSTGDRDPGRPENLVFVRAGSGPAPAGRQTECAQAGASKPFTSESAGIRRAIEAEPLVPAQKYLLASGRGDEAWRSVRPPMVELTDAEGAALLEGVRAAGFDPAPLALA